jgi:phosphohistidine phosphatase
MHVYLMRHGEAQPEAVDPAQPLHEAGRAEVLRVARHLVRIGADPVEILHSSKLRARQTANLLVAALGPALGAREVNWLGPMTAPAFARAELEAAAEPVMLVGHLPFLARLVALLLTGGPDADLIRFRPATIVQLERSPAGWTIGWVLPAELALTGC